MITTKHGSIFDSTAQALVCPVNCVGVMGKGLALEFKRRWPMLDGWYRGQCAQKLVSPGCVGKWGRVVLFSTKDDWRLPSRIEWIDSGLAELAEMIMNDRLRSIAIPQLGCGCGGLDWADVWPLYERHLGALDCDVEVWIHE